MSTKNVITRYYKIKGTDNEYLKAELYYSLGGHNCFTYKEEQRGYYVSISPVKREGYMESYTAFSGTKMCVVPCKRKSNGKESEAIELFDDKMLYLYNAAFSEFDIDFENYESR